MVALAAAENPGFVVDERELKRDTPPGPSTPLSSCVMNCRTLRSAFDGDGLLLGLPSWHRWQELLDYAHLVVSTRPGWQPDYPKVAELLARHQSRQVADLHRLRHGRIWLADNLPVELSATRLRALLATGADPRYLLPPSVAQYIRQQGLYRPA